MSKHFLKFILAYILITMPLTGLSQSPINLNNIDIKLSSGDEEINIIKEKNSQYFEEIYINNNSSEEITIEIKKNHANLENRNFKVENNKAASSYVDEWLKIDKSNLKIKPGEQEKVKLEINIPENAPVGKSHGALLFIQKISTTNFDTKIEKGVRIKIDIPGEERFLSKIISQEKNEDSKNVYYKKHLLNNGNTNLSGTISIKTLSGEKIFSEEKTDFFLRPGEDQKFELKAEKPAIGFYQTILDETLKNKVKTSILSENFNLNSENTGIAILAIYILLAFYIKNAAASPKKSKAGIFLFITLTTLLLSNLNTEYIKSNVFQTIPETGYLTTIKWTGENSDLKTAWKGKIKSNSGIMLISDFLHVEKTDNFNLDQKNNLLNFDNFTGPDNDGIVLFIKPDQERQDEPIIQIENSYSKHTFKVPLSRTLKKDYSLGYKGQKITVSTVVAPETVNYINNGKSFPLKTKTADFSNEILLEKNITGEISTIEDLQSTEENTIDISKLEYSKKQDLLNELNLLREVISELPTSPEIISEYILNSSFVEEVVSENNTSTVSTSASLIETLKETPNIIQEITQTPEINFVFIPKEKIKLPSQIFSFERSNSTTQSFGEILFTQNKEQNWNAYISISDFTSASGRGSISASNITIDPGIINNIKENSSTIIETGQPYKLNGPTDQAVLVFVQPNGNQESIFSLNPKITLNIPPNTPPGLYRAEVTIRII